MRVLVSGASGLIGSALAPALRHQGHEVRALVRRMPRDRAQESGWDPERGYLAPDALDGIDAVVHLAGANIAAGRWTPKRRRAIVRSRVEPTALLARELVAAARPPQVWISASAIGFYGHRGADEVDETAGPGSGFVAAVAQQWEAATAPAAAAGIRVVRARFGLVLSPTGGALARLLPLFRLGLGGRLGDGRQYWSWVTLTDAVAVLIRALADPSLHGAVNVVAPSPVTCAEFTRTLGQALGRPVWLPVPALLLRLAMGQMAQELLLSGARVRPEVLLAKGFRFAHGQLPLAWRDLLPPRSAASAIPRP
jgi:uncharacterized protein (TIGR01777 family)